MEKRRSYQRSSELEIGDSFKKELVRTIRELRTTPEGKEELARTGRDANENKRRPGASATRRFVAWDGEGITRTKGHAQDYVLFGNSEGMSIESRSLPTKDCLNLMIDAELEHPTAFHVGFAFNYDVNMILKDVPRARLERLREEKTIRWGSYRIEWYPSKWFQVSKKMEDGKRVTCRIWDVWGFFQSSFVVALRSYLGKRDDVNEVEAGKSKRGEFADDEMDYIRRYWSLELDLLVALCMRLRSYLYSAGLKITQWHGPGAVASFRTESRKDASSHGRMSERG